MKIPDIKISKDVLTISISLSELIFVIENSGEWYEVSKPDLLLQAFKFQFENHANSNATEKGISELQNLIDQIADEVFISGDDIIIQNNPSI